MTIHHALFFLLITTTFAPSLVAAFLPPQVHHTTKTTTPKLIFSATLSPEEELQKRYNDGDGLGDVQIPSTGVSIRDEMESSEKDRFETELVPIEGFKQVAAQLVTTSTSTGSFEAVRYVVSLDPAPKTKSKAAKNKEEEGEKTTITESTSAISTQKRSFVLIDIPPFSAKLVAELKQFMGDSQNNELAAILVTNRDAIHYDDAPAVYRLRRTDLEQWKQAFPGLEIVAYRLDIPRDCRDSVTQVLDGYGPFALDSNSGENQLKFEEMGRPLTEKLWDHDVAQDILRGRKAIEERTEEEMNQEEYSEDAIRAKEENKKILAVYTPGHSYGSVCYVFPETGLCASGYTLPIEDNREDENTGMTRTGPMLDCRGYITTNRGGIVKQMESARQFVRKYCDRFNVVLPSRGDPLIFNDEDGAEEKKEILLDILNQYEKIGKIYEEMGIFDEDED